MSQRGPQTFSSSAELAASLAGEVSDRLRAGLKTHGTASLIVSGGRTPIMFFSELSKSQLDWAKVDVQLADERWVPAEADRSNAALIKQHLMINRARDARFVPLYSVDQTPQQAAAKWSSALAAGNRPFDAVVLGMGGDGHTASLFPDAPEINQALATQDELAMVLNPASQPEVRLSMTPPALCNSQFLALHIEGRDKHDVLTAARREGPAEEMPVRAILRNDNRPAQVYWCA